MAVEVIGHGRQRAGQLRADAMPALQLGDDLRVHQLAGAEDDHAVADLFDFGDHVRGEDHRATGLLGFGHQRRHVGPDGRDRDSTSARPESPAAYRPPASRPAPASAACRSTSTATGRVSSRPKRSQANRSARPRLPSRRTDVKKSITSRARIVRNSRASPGRYETRGVHFVRAVVAIEPVDRGRAGRGPQIAHQQPQERRLARAVGPQQADDFAPLDAEREFGQGREVSRSASSESVFRRTRLAQGRWQRVTAMVERSGTVISLLAGEGTLGKRSAGGAERVRRTKRHHWRIGRTGALGAGDLGRRDVGRGAPPAPYRLNKNAGLLINAQARSWAPVRRSFFCCSAAAATASCSRTHCGSWRGSSRPVRPAARRCARRAGWPESRRCSPAGSRPAVGSALASRPRGTCRSCACRRTDDRA